MITEAKTRVPGIDGDFHARLVEGKYAPTVELPDKLSDMVALAIADYKALSEFPELYHPDSEVWHQPDYFGDGSACGVCLAGAVVANTFNAAIEERIAFDDFGGDAEIKLSALDKVRQGDIWPALELLGVFAGDLFRQGDMPTIVAVDALEREARAEKWSEMRKWEGWDELADSLDYLTHISDGLRAVGL